jgi:hemerythrin-like domain-containing protein
MNEIEKSTNVLREEHQLIENALVAIAAIIKKLEKGNPLDRGQVWEMAGAFATFVGRTHHGK